MTDTTTMTPEQLARLSPNQLRVWLHERFGSSDCFDAEATRITLSVMDELLTRAPNQLDTLTVDEAIALIHRQVARLYEKTDLEMTEASGKFAIVSCPRTDDTQRRLVENVRRLCLWYEARYADYVRDVHGTTSDGREFHWTCLRAA